MPRKTERPNKRTSITIAAMRQLYAVVTLGGKTMIARFHDSRFNDLISVEAFRNEVRDKCVFINGERLDADVAYLESPDRRYYPDGIHFDPGEAPNSRSRNTWRGFETQSRPGDASPFIEFLRDVICDGDAEADRYLTAWLAHLIQFPHRKPGTAIVLIGGQGTGKSTFADYILRRIIGTDYVVTVDSGKAIARNFNQQFYGKLVCILEEGRIQRRDANSVKHLITSPTLLYEPKGVDPYTGPNHLHVIVCTNDLHPVHAQNDERRYLCIRVSEKSKGDTAYFNYIRDWFDKGGAEIVMGYLRNYDISDVDLRIVPRTKAMLAQKINSFGPIERSLYQLLESGLNIYGDHWSAQVTKEAFADFVNSQKQKWEPAHSIDAIAKRLKELLPTLGTSRPSGNGPRPRAFVFPPLDECRRAFETYVGQPVDWDLADDEGPDDGGGKA
jgi:hypothetical protein